MPSFHIFVSAEPKVVFVDMRYVKEGDVRGGASVCVCMCWAERIEWIKNITMWLFRTNLRVLFVRLVSFVYCELFSNHKTYRTPYDLQISQNVSGCQEKSRKHLRMISVHVPLKTETSVFPFKPPSLNIFCSPVCFLESLHSLENFPSTHRFSVFSAYCFIHSPRHD